MYNNKNKILKVYFLKVKCHMTTSRQITNSELGRIKITIKSDLIAVKNKYVIVVHDLNIRRNVIVCEVGVGNMDVLHTVFSVWP